jgi:hypothetical protein
MAGRLRSTVKDGMKTLTFLVVLVAATLTIAGAAFAQSSNDGYLAGAEQVAGQVQGTNAEQASASTGSLPFTGLDVALVAGGGLLLLGAGFAMRRITPGTRSA